MAPPSAKAAAEYLSLETGLMKNQKLSQL